MARSGEAASTTASPARHIGALVHRLGTVNGTAKFVSSAIVGMLWTAVSPVLGFGVAAGLMVLGTFALGFSKRP
jgi:hypothetical protein